MKSLTLEELCRPVLSFICDARRYNCAKHQITLTEFTDGIMFRLNAIQEQCRQDVVLAKEYAKIEKPLLFFIDYIVMDGNFSFANEWEPQARKHKEYSGDEKFFELLAEAINDPESDARLEEFFYMMALGFYGVHQEDPGFIEREMRVCAARFSHDSKDSTEFLSPADLSLVNRLKKRKRRLSVPALLLTCSLLFAVVALCCNTISLLSKIEEYHSALRDTRHAAGTISIDKIFEAYKQFYFGDIKKTNKEDKEK